MVVPEVEASPTARLSDPTLEDRGGALEFGVVTQIARDGDPSRSGVRSPVIGPVFMGRSDRLALKRLSPEVAQPGLELGPRRTVQPNEVRREHVGHEFSRDRQ